MEYKINLGVWNSIFAVPCDIVDKHLKLAGAAQLKVILWVLRHTGENFTVEDISAALSMSAADVRDSMLYWKETGIICERDGILFPPEPEKPEIKEPVSIPEEIKKPEEDAAASETEEQPAVVEHKPSRVVSRPEKPDLKYLTERINSDESIVYLMQTADEIFGRPTSNNDKATLLMIHETDGLPVEVLIMLMQYAAGLGKCNIRYIEKTAINWADEEIFSLEKAEQKIQQLTSGRSAAGMVQKLFGLDSHSPTDKETEYADRWLNLWKFSPDLVRYAYEICVNSKGKYIPKYVDSVLERWHNTGISTMVQAEEDQNRGKKKQQNNKKATYDINTYESTNAIIEEGF